MDSKINKSTLAKVIKGMQQRQTNHLKKEMITTQALGDSRNYRRKSLESRTALTINMLLRLTQWRAFTD